ncbi:MAG: methylated-DNA--[protein]-cysteine S-methyltransferase [Bdellovibrionales bacterium]
MSEMIIYGIFDFELGDVVLARSEIGICWLGFMYEGYKGNGYDRMITYYPDAEFMRDDAQLLSLWQDILHAWADDCFQDLSLDLRGTDFQHDVWTALGDIKKGHVCSYSDIANDIGRPKAVRAVGSAVGENPVSLIVPCHRVVQKTGGLGNYGWGREIKRSLLLEECVSINDADSVMVVG